MAEAETDTFEDAAAPDAPGIMPMRPYLFVILECDRPTSGGARHALTGVDEVVIGRGNVRSAARQSREGVSQLFVRVPGRSMSSAHARITRVDRGWLLEDMGSTNGSTVNGSRVDRCMLEDGDVIELGHTIFALRCTVPTPPGTPLEFDSLRASTVETGLATLDPTLATEFAALAQVARSDLPLLLLGETGTGKEVLARAVHRISGREGPFVAVNCGAIPANLVESQLFGHVKGAFTGATRDELGFVRGAAGGTLLLDEIGDLPLAAQPALLRVLQESEVVPVGTSRPTQVDVRIIAATHRRLDSLTATERFRHDLMARLDIYRFELPPLARRIVDIGCIVAQSLAHIMDPFHLSPEAGTALTMHSWASNIRELVVVLRRAAVLARGGFIESRHLGLSPAPQRTRRLESGRPKANERQPDAALREELLSRLTEARGNIAEVARGMGKARMQIHRWMRRLGIDSSHFRADLRLDEQTRRVRN